MAELERVSQIYDMMNSSEIVQMGSYVYDIETQTKI